MTVRTGSTRFLLSEVVRHGEKFMIEPDLLAPGALGRSFAASLEHMRQTQCQSVLRQRPEVALLALVQRAEELGADVRRWRVVVGENGRDRVPEARDCTEAGKESEQSRCRAQPSYGPFGLMNELPTALFGPEPESVAIDVLKRDRWRDFQASLKKLGRKCWSANRGGWRMSSRRHAAFYGRVVDVWTLIVTGAFSSLSLRLNEFDQLKPPILSGVLKLELVFLVFRLRRTLSCPPLGFRKKR